MNDLPIIAALLQNRANYLRQRRAGEFAVRGHASMGVTLTVRPAGSGAAFAILGDARILAEADDEAAALVSLYRKTWEAQESFVREELRAMAPQFAAKF